MTPQPRKKVTRSHHNPTLERQSPTCKTKMSGTPMKTPLAMESKDFSMEHGTNTMEIVKPGCVIKAKMKLEERIRKEKPAPRSH